jgi:16S rRNA C967 or C1407 C5-methylase (RsmB/RsmF family)
MEHLLPRYLRIVNFQGSDALVDEPFSEIHWQKNFVALSGNQSLSQLRLSGIDYKILGLFPMDISSSLPVLALNIDRSQSRKILDLCCCPGGKLLYLSEVAGEGSTVCGVDISESRLSVCKSLLYQWQPRFNINERVLTLLFQADGRQFSAANTGRLLYDSSLKIINQTQSMKFNKSTRAKISKALQLSQQRINTLQVDQDHPLYQFDYVLVDAECTHDASYRHLQYFRRGNAKKWLKKRTRSDEEIDEELDWGDEDLPMPTMVDTHSTATATSTATVQTTAIADANLIPENTAEEESKMIVDDMHLSHNIRINAVDDISTDAQNKLALRDLQRGLLQNGFQQLAVGGTLVYSTCSSDIAQNEDIVAWLLAEENTAELQPCLPHFPIISSTTSTPILPNETIQQLFDTMITNPSQIPTNEESQQVCDYFASLEMPLLIEGHLPGTIRVNYQCGMSGHFIATITKRNSVV